MSEVKRYDMDGFGGGLVARPDGAWYHFEDFDRVVAERDALQQRLTAADELVATQCCVFCNDTGNLRSVHAQLQQRADLLESAVALLVKVTPRNNSSYADKLEALEILKGLPALKPAEVSKCCTISADDRALLEAGDYTPEELFGTGGKPSCPKCAS